MNVMEWRRLGLSTFREKPPDTDTKTGQCQDLEDNSGRARQGHRDAEGPATSETPMGRQGPGCRPRVEKGGANRHGNDSRCRHAARGVGTSGGGWRAVGVGDVQMGGASHRERRWGAGEN